MRELDARRAVLDHVLTLVAGSSLADHLVLRGSRLLQAWAGLAAREPADLDWIVVAPVEAPGPELVVSPYGDLVDLVEEWPQFEVGGRCHVGWWDVDDPPVAEDHRLDAVALLDPHVDLESSDDWAEMLERQVGRLGGLDWTVVDTLDEVGDAVRHPYQDLLELLAREPVAAPGVVLDPADVKRSREWSYAYGWSDGDENDDDCDGWYEAMPGARIAVPYRIDGVPAGEVQLDFAYDEWIPEPPVWTRIPRTGSEGPEIVLRAPSPEQSLAWKRYWLRRDRHSTSGPRDKDVYDVALLERLISSLPDWW